MAFTRSAESSGILGAAPQSAANALQSTLRPRVHLLFSWAAATRGAGLKILVSAVRFRPWALVLPRNSRDRAVSAVSLVAAVAECSISLPLAVDGVGESSVALRAAHVQRLAEVALRVRPGSDGEPLLVPRPYRSVCAAQSVHDRHHTRGEDEGQAGCGIGCRASRGCPRWTRGRR